MNYLYHGVPVLLEGKELMPLNDLKKEHPKMYKEEVKKYEGRKKLLKIKVPLLNCLWNDVLHFSAIHPKKIKKAIIESGFNAKYKWKFFKVNPKLFNLKKIIVYLYDYKIRNKPLKKDFVPFKVKDLPKYSKLKKATKDYYKKEIKNNKRPLMYHLVPHILYKGRLKIKDLEVIEV